MARAAKAVGADGVIVETHRRPEEALSGGGKRRGPSDAGK